MAFLVTPFAKSAGRLSGKPIADRARSALVERYALADVRMAYALETVMPLQPGLVEVYPHLHAAMLKFFNTAGVR